MFDLIMGTNTSKMHRNLNYYELHEKPENYMVSWTTTIKKSFNAFQKIESASEKYTFCDVGSGKGKALIVWGKLQIKSHGHYKLIGFELLQDLVDICRDNLKIVSLSEAKIYPENILDFDLSEMEPNTIYFLYNPFGIETLIKFIRNLRGNFYVIYVNPKYSDFMDNELVLVHNQTGWHPNLCFSIYRNIDR